MNRYDLKRAFWYIPSEVGETVSICEGDTTNEIAWDVPRDIAEQIVDKHNTFRDLVAECCADATLL